MVNRYFTENEGASHIKPNDVIFHKREMKQPHKAKFYSISRCHGVVSVTFLQSRLDKHFAAMFISVSS